MGSFKVSAKELLLVRKKLFVEVGIPELLKNGFTQSPFSTSWSGRNNLGDFNYDLCRVADDSELEYLDVYINRGDRYIKVKLNIFKLLPEINSIEQLQGGDGLNYCLMPNSKSQMQLRSDDYKAPPLFYMLFLPEHKIGWYFSKSGFDRQVRKLTELIKKDTANIDCFVKRWHELHEPNQTDWEGNRLENK